MSQSNANSTMFLVQSNRAVILLGFVAGLIAVIGGLVLGFGGPIAALGLFLAILATIVVMRDIEIGFWGIIGIVFLLPFATIPVDIGLTPTLLDLALAATIGVWLLRLVTGQRRTIVTSPITLPLVIFIVVTIFAFIFGMGNGPLTANLLRHFAELLLSIGFVLVIIDYFSQWYRIERVIRVILIAGGVAALISIILWLLPDLTANDMLNALQRVGYPGGFVIRYIEENPELAERAIGTSVDPNALGGLLLMIGALGAPQIIAKKPLMPRWAILLISALILLALFLTFSRGAMLGLLAGLGFVTVARYRRVIPFLLLIMVIILFLPITQDYLARFVEGFQGQDLATQMRFGEYRDALTLIARYPLFGVGFSGSPDIDLYLGVASVYFTIGQQMGFLGVIAFLAVIGTVFGYGYTKRQYFRDNDQIDPIWLGLHASLIGGLTVGIFDHYLFNIDFHHAVTVFWLFLGLAVAATRVGSEMMVRAEENPNGIQAIQGNEL